MALNHESLGGEHGSRELEGQEAPSCVRWREGEREELRVSRWQYTCRGGP